MDEIYIDRNTTELVEKKDTKEGKVFIEPFPILPTVLIIFYAKSQFHRQTKNKFGKCKLTDKDIKINSKSSYFLEFYNDKEKGQPYVSRLYTGFDFRK